MPIPKYAANPGMAAISIFASDLTAAFGAGSEFGIYIANRGTPVFTWQTVFSAAPTTVTVLLEASLDGLNWFTIDSSSNINGELRTVFGAYRFVRINNSAVTGGAGKTLSASFVYTTTLQNLNLDSVLFADAPLNLPTLTTGVDEVLKTVIIPGGSLSTGVFNGIEIDAALLAAVNVNAKSCALRVGGIVVASIVGDINSANRFYLYSKLITSTSSSLDGYSTTPTTIAASLMLGAPALTGLNFNSNINIEVIATTGVAAGDISLRSLRVALLSKVQ